MRARILLPEAAFVVNSTVAAKPQRGAISELYHPMTSQEVITHICNALSTAGAMLCPYKK